MSNDIGPGSRQPFGCSHCGRRAGTRDVARMITLGVVTSIGLAACAAGNTATQAAPRPVAPEVADSDSTTVTMLMPTDTGSTNPEAPITTTTTTTTTEAPATTIAPTVEVVEAVCDSLRFDGLETRRVMVDALAAAFTEAGGIGDGRADVAALCGPELERLDGLSHGLFRRGADGQWRWLSSARYFESAVSDDCAGVDPAT